MSLVQKWGTYELSMCGKYSIDLKCPIIGTVTLVLCAFHEAQEDETKVLNERINIPHATTGGKNLSYCRTALIISDR